ncbi:MAG: hypothetical protein DCC57_18255 [Chloroflexi bacterium]|nr:MAG: hypothetical protein DCC57_18255 [Chloroflexota bacterium]
MNRGLPAGALILLALALGVWLLPIQGRVTVETGAATGSPAWPQIIVSPPDPLPGQSATVTVTDDQSWAYVKLTADGQPARFIDWDELQPGRLWQWRWELIVPSSAGVKLAFYTDCHLGCRSRGKLALGRPSTALSTGVPTKLCVAFPDPARNWHGRRGWVVDMTYMQLADDEQDPFWSVDALAGRVAQATAQGLRVLVRVEYDRDQTLPPTEDYMGLSAYVAYVQRLGRDARLQGVYGYIIGSGMNAADSNGQAPANPITPAWYARLFNGYGETPTHMDNVVAALRAEHPTVRILVGSLRPWVSDQDVEAAHGIDAPWLNYMDALVSALDAGAQAKAEAGIAWGAPDGFALHAPGRPSAPELGDLPRDQEPRQDLARAAWGGAQAGFRVYQDWVAVIDRYATTRGLPVYITATNTFAPDESEPPAQNYPPGWLGAAADVVQADPRVQTLCWFLDLVPGDDRWDPFSLARGQGRMIYAAEEFDALLQGN